jgi:hypothetical protein
MKKIFLVLMTAVLLAGGALALTPAPSYAQVYPPPPADIHASPWVGDDTPWVYYNGDWFLDGVLYYFFGPKYGWAPYYAYGPSFIVRPNNWYGSRWSSWYRGHPNYHAGFKQQYPHYVAHQQGRVYTQKFYEQHHSGQGGGWHKGFERH